MMKWTEFQSCIPPIVCNRQIKGEPTQGQQSQHGFAKHFQVRQGMGKEKPFRIIFARKWPKSVLFCPSKPGVREGLGFIDFILRKSKQGPQEQELTLALAEGGWSYFWVKRTVFSHHLKYYHSAVKSASSYFIKAEVCLKIGRVNYPNELQSLTPRWPLLPLCQSLGWVYPVSPVPNQFTDTGSF